MRVAILPGDTGACGHYRLIWPADAVRRVRPSWDVTVHDPRTVKIERTSSGLRIHGLPDGLDLLVVQRVGSPKVADMVEYLQAHGTAIALDMDDAMWALDPSNTAYRAWNTQRSGLHWSVIDQVANIADMVTVTTDALARRYGPHGRVEILPNRIPRMALTARRNMSPRSPHRAPAAGWSGLLSTHPHDPKVIGDAFVKLGSKVRPAVMGDAYRTGKMWGVKPVELKTTSLGMDYYRQLTNLDIGLVPLDLAGTSAEFNAGKSSLKALEMAATGSAVVASPSPANLELAREVPIRIAATPDAWARHIGELADPVVRSEQVSKQRAAIEASWVLQDRAEDWATAWEQAINNRRNS